MTDPKLNRFYQRLDELLPNTMREFMKRSANDLTKGRITMPQLVILELLNKKGTLIMSELAGSLSITTSAVTGLIDRMIKANLVMRSRDEKDRRIVKVTLIPKGKQVIENILRERKKVLLDIFGKFTQNERQQYLKIIEKMYHILKGRKD